MTLIQFLQWLFGRIDKALDWFGWQYSSFRNTVANTWTWIVTKAGEVYASANQYAVTKIGEGLVTVSGWIGAGRLAILEIVYTIQGNIYLAIGGAKTWAQGKVDEAVASLIAIINSIYGWVDGVVETAKVILKTFASGLVTAAIILFSPLLPLIWVMDKLLDLTGLNTYSKVKTITGSAYYMLIGFAQRPVSFILSLLWGEFINFFCYVIGYNLGTVNASLPNLPAWGDSAGGQVVGQETEVVIGNWGLVIPVNPLTVSGYLFGASHKGTDFGLALGQNVYAAHDGIVQGAGWSTVGYGYKVDLQGDNIWSRYAHLQTILVTDGQRVSAGAVLGLGNSTGNSTGNHLHFELRINGVYVDPLLYF